MRTGVRVIAFLFFLVACAEPDHAEWARQYEGTHETTVELWRLPCGTSLSETDLVPPSETFDATIEISAASDGAHFSVGPCSIVTYPRQRGHGLCEGEVTVWGAGIADLSTGARLWAAWDTTTGACETTYARALIRSSR